MGLYSDGRNAACGPCRVDAVWHPVHVFPQPDVAVGLRVPGSFTLLLLFGLRYTNDDGRQAQVFNQSRGICLCGTEPLHGHYQHLHVHSGHSGQHQGLKGRMSCIY